MATTRPDTTREDRLLGLQQAAAQLRAEEGWAALQELALSNEPAPIGWELTALQTLEQAGWSEAFEPRLRELLQNPDVRPEAGRLWARMNVDHRKWDAFKALRRLLDLGPVGEAAAVAWIQALAERRERYQLLRAASIGEFWLSGSDVVWEAMALALCETQQPREAHFWIADWRARESRSPQLLLCVAEILRAAGDPLSGAEANLLALNQQPPEPLRSRHECWLALDSVLGGNYEDAAARLQRIDPAGFPPGDRLQHTMLTIAVSIGAAEPGQAATIAADARQSVDDAIAGYPELAHDPARQRTVNHVLRQMAAADGLGVKFWAWRRRI